MLQKVLAIAWNGLYQTIQDRNALAYMFAAPLGISLIIGLVFGNSSDDISLPDSEILVVNQDAGAENNGQPLNLGAQYVDFLVENPPEALQELLTGETSTDLEAARQQVEDGDAQAVLIIPADFTARIISGGQAEAELYYNPASDIGTAITSAVIQSITDSINRVSIAQGLTVGGADGYFIPFAANGGDIGAAVEQISVRLSNPEEANLVRLQNVNVSGEVEEVNAVAYFAPSMAILFMTFTVAAGARSILQEQTQWTMQRILSTPTPRWVYLVGRMMGIFTTGVLQMLILLMLTPVISAIAGSGADVWGDAYLGLFLMTLAVVLAGTGLGLLIAAGSGSVEQADSNATGILFLTAMLGGSFVQVDGVPFLRDASRLTLNHWGIDGFFDLANHNATLADVLPNIGVLLAMGVVFFLLALWRFRARLDF